MHSSTLGKCAGGGKNAIPFHRGRNSCHHARSARKLVFRRNHGGTMTGMLSGMEEVEHPPEEGPT